MLDKEPRLGLTYDDVVLVPAKSAILPSEVEVSTEEDNADAQAFYRRLGFTGVALLLEHELD